MSDFATTMFKKVGQLLPLKLFLLFGLSVGLLPNCYLLIVYEFIVRKPREGVSAHTIIPIYYL